MPSRAAVSALFDDPQFAQLAVQATALLAALSRRSTELGASIEPEMLVRAVSSVLADAGRRELAAASSGAIVSLNAVRQAREPVKIGYITLTPEPAAFELIDELALRDHGEVNATTRALALQAALQRGLTTP